MNYFSYLFAVIVLISCESKAYFPDVNATRDKDLVGTWMFANESADDSSAYVFTADGYVGYTSYINNAQIQGFTNLYQLWHNTEAIGDDGWGKIYVADLSSSWVMKRNENEEYYKFTESKDTLYMAYVNLKTKKADKENPSILIKRKYQLLFDGPFYLGLDSVTVR